MQVYMHSTTQDTTLFTLLVYIQHFSAFVFLIQKARRGT